MIFEHIWGERPDGRKVWNSRKAAAGLGGIFTPSMDRALNWAQEHPAATFFIVSLVAGAIILGKVAIFGTL